LPTTYAKMITVFLLFLAFPSEATVHYNDIDLQRCEGDTFCVVRKYCDDSNTRDKLTERPSDGHGDGCDVIIQIKPFSATKFHVFLRIKKTDNGEPLKHSRGITLILKHREAYFTCSELGVTYE
ncbi:hypothetical protein PFISCL1PPCAC_417, partial [Pristionchus fissidentatus]